MADSDHDRLNSDDENLSDLDAESDIDADAGLDEMMLRCDTVGEVAKVLHGDRLPALLEKIEESQQAAAGGASAEPLAVGSPEYLLLQEANDVVGAIVTDVKKAHKFLRTKYVAQFPELEGILADPVVYAKVVRCVRNRTDVPGIREDLTTFLRQSELLVVMMTLSNTKGKPISDEEAQVVTDAAETILSLEEAKAVLVEYMGTKMAQLAPNLSELLGSNVAATLVCVAGGLSQLSKMNSNIIRMLGKKKKSSLQVSGRELIHAGAIGDAALVQSIPASLPKLRRRAASMVGDKVSLVLRMDSQRSCADGSYGRKLYGEIQKKVDDWRKPTAAPARDKALKAPDDRPKNRRAGAKVRRMTAKYKQTEISKSMNRMEFGTLEEDDYTGEASFSGVKRDMSQMQLKAETTMRPSKKARVGGYNTAAQKGSAALSGKATSVAFTPFEGGDVGAVATIPDQDTSKMKYFGKGAMFKVC